MFKSKKRIIAAAITAFLLIIGTILYLLADRYLIEHVEIRNVNTGMGKTSSISSSTDAGTASEGTTDTSQSSGSENAAGAASDTETQTQADEDTSNEYTADDWNYTGNDTSISIKQVTTGSGNNTVTYFVADVKLSDASQLTSAFAKNQFGRNIIEYTSQIAADNNAVFAINGDYYGFRTNGIEIRNGVIYRDEPARTGLAIYKDGTMKVYEETRTSAQELLDQGVWNTLSFGPALLVHSIIPEDLENQEVDTNFGNHSIQGSHPRTGIGIIDENHFVFIVVDGRSSGYSRGATLTEFAQIFKDLGCTDAYNLDGGGSSTMYFMGRVVNNPQGKHQERGVSDILYIG
jgi:exopolysaccharide biosynthesis protein